MRPFFATLATALLAVSMTGLAEAGTRPGGRTKSASAHGHKGAGTSKKLYSTGKSRVKYQTGLQNKGYRNALSATGKFYKSGKKSGTSFKAKSSGKWNMPYKQFGQNCCCLPGNYKCWSKCCWMPSHGCQACYCPQDCCWYYYHPSCGCYLPWSCINDYPPPCQSDDGSDCEDDGDQSSWCSGDPCCDDGLAGDDDCGDDGSDPQPPTEAE